MKNVSVFFLSVGMGLCVRCAGAQDAKAGSVATAAPPAYDVSTIRLNGSDSHNGSIHTNNGVFTAENAPLKWLLSNAFDLRQEMIYGLPAWADKARYDLNAKDVEADPKELEKLKPEQLRAMQQTLYADRFGLRWHYETRVLPDYDLVLNKGAAKLKPTPGKTEKDGTWNLEDTRLQGTAVSMRVLATMLAEAVHRPVTDKTGLTGTYDLQLSFRRVDSDASVEGTKEADPGSAPDLFTALREQFGLKLRAGKDPVQVLVIDKISPPSAN